MTLAKLCSGAAIGIAALSLSTTAHAAAAMFDYAGAGCTGLKKLPQFESFIGRKVDGVVDFVDVPNWNTMAGWTDWSLGCWSKTNVRLALSVPMLTRDGTTTLAQGASGAYDHYYSDFGKLLVAKGRADAYLRIGWEFNGDWYPWSANKDPAAFKAYFRRIVAALRSIPGAHFSIVWNPTSGVDKVAPDEAYPGDDVVDVIGLDVYNSSWRHSGSDSPAVRWQERLEGDYGLNWLASFAMRHKKPIAIPEWGTGLRPDGHGFGDDPVFIKNMAAWIAAHDVVFQGYWDYPAPDYNAEISTGRYPNSAQAFKAAFGSAKATPP